MGLLPGRGLTGRWGVVVCVKGNRAGRPANWTLTVKVFLYVRPCTLFTSCLCIYASP